MDSITAKSSSPAGDLISFLAGLKSLYDKFGRKSKVFQRLDMPGVSYEGSMHPFQDESGQPVCMNKAMFDRLYPLLKAQEYIEDFLIYEGQEVQFDFDLIRMERFTNQPKGSLNRYYNYVFPEMASDLSKEWIKVKPNTDLENKVIINFTQRHRNHFIQYYFLKPHQHYLVFAGLEKERKLFCESWGLDIPLLEEKNVLDLAEALKGCRFFMGCQSMCFQVAEALKVPRILETFPLMPNVIPIGEKAYDFYAQEAAEFYFNQLIKHN